MNRKGYWKNILTGVGIAGLLFILIGVVIDLQNGGQMQFSGYRFTKMAVGTILIGLGFGVPALIYQNENMSLLVQTLIHMGIGCLVLILVGVWVGWLPVGSGGAVLARAILLDVGIAFGIWALFYRHNKKLAMQMNQRIRQMKEEEKER